MTADYIKLTCLASFGVDTPEGQRPLFGGHPRSSMIEGPDGRLHGTAMQNGPRDGGGVVDTNGDGTLEYQSASSNYYWAARDLVKNIEATEAQLIAAHAQLASPEIESQIQALEALLEQLKAQLAERWAINKRKSPGTVFSVSKTGGDLRVEHEFSHLDENLRNTDGYQPVSPLVAHNGRIYGTAAAGGLSGSNTATTFGVGTAFSYRPGEPDSFETLYHFGRLARYNDGAVPQGALIPDGDGFIATCSKGSDFGAGVIARIAGGAAMQVFRFVNTSDPSNGPAVPYGAPVRAGDGKLYGWTTYGGLHDAGCVYAVDPTNSAWELVASFPPYTWDGNRDNSPLSSPIVGTDGHIYGTSEFGGMNGSGFVWKLELPSRAFSILKHFGPRNVNATPRFANTEGQLPCGSLCQDRYGHLVGTTIQGGAHGRGVIFQLTRDGSQFVVLHSFEAGPMGHHPHAGLIREANGHVMYGTCYAGGGDAVQGGFGTVYKIEPVGFAAITGAELGTRHESNPVRLGCLVTPTIRVSGPGAQYSLNGGAWTSAQGTAKAGDEVRLAVTSSSTPRTRVLATLSLVGMANASFAVTTKA